MAKGYGISEQTVGRWLRRSDRRDDIVLATKVYQPMGLGPNDRRLSEYHIRRIADPVDAADHHRRQLRKQNPGTILNSHRPRALRTPASGQPRASITQCVPEPDIDR
jgi:hypothetical protein